MIFILQLIVLLLLLDFLFPKLRDGFIVERHLETKSVSLYLKQSVKRKSHIITIVHPMLFSQGCWLLGV